MFIDLYQLVTEHPATHRAELLNDDRRIGICAIGGFPIQELHGEYYWGGNRLVRDTMRINFLKALGLGGMLTFLNPPPRALGPLAGPRSNPQCATVSANFRQQ